MELDPTTFDVTLASFLEAWPISRIENMTIEEYADLSDHNSFCYWLEYGTSNLGAIGNNPLTKFGIWKPKNPKDFSKSIIFDGEYAWVRTKGEERSNAFERIKRDVLRIVNLSSQKQWDELRQVNLHTLVKWKIAFLYSENELLPIYSKRALSAISRGLGYRYNETSDIYEMQSSILTKRGEKKIDDFAHELYSRYAQKPNFFVVGTKYGTTDIFPSLVKNNCIAIGYLWNHDLSDLFNADRQTIDQFVSENRGKDEPSFAKLSRQIRQFLSLKNGDIIALKSQGAHNRLTIIGYAIVSESDGKIYEHDPGDLGHVIHVEFLETGFSKFLGLNYADSIHKIAESGDHFKVIFGKYSVEGDEELLNEDDIPVEDEEESIFDKNETEHVRKGSSDIIVKQLHNKIQNRFVKFLKGSYPGLLSVEYKKRVDVRREEGDTIWLYEVKPYEDAYRCVRESIGQLLDYSYRFPTSKEVRIVTVGPNKADDQAVEFVNHLKKQLNVDYSYMAFDLLSKSVLQEV